MLVPRKIIAKQYLPIKRALSAKGVSSIKDLFRNWAFCDDYDESSFIYKLHELSVWDDKEYWKLDDAIHEIAHKLDSVNEIPRDVAWPIARIFSYLMVLFEAHHNQFDAFEIEGFEPEDVYIRRERVQLVFEGFFEGKMIPNDSFDYSKPSG